MAALSIQERKRLRQIGHALNPVVMIGGQGLTEGVIEETNRALNDHELIKVKIAGEDREARGQVIDALIEATGAQAVQKIGKIVLLYKKGSQTESAFVESGSSRASFKLIIFSYG